MFKKIAIAVIIYLMSFIDTIAMNDPAGGRAAAIGSASVTFIDAYAAQNNQAATAFLKNKSFGVYTENRFLIEGLTSAGAIAIIPTSSGVFSCNINYFGYDLYNEFKGGIGYGRSLTSNFSIGAQFNYLQIELAEYGSATAFLIEGGVLYKPLPQLLIGAHIYNPVNTTLGDDKGFIPVILKIGAAYIASEKVTFVAEAEKDILKTVLLKAGIEYKMNSSFTIRSGLQDLDRLSFGFGINTGKFNIDMAAAYHQVLGFSPVLSLNYEVKRS